MDDVRRIMPCLRMVGGREHHFCLPRLQQYPILPQSLYPQCMPPTTRSAQHRLLHSGIAAQAQAMSRHAANLR